MPQGSTSAEPGAPRAEPRPDATNPVSPSELAALQAGVARRLPEFLDDLRTLVGIDCGSYTKSGVDEVGRWVARELVALGASVEIVRQPELGDIVLGTLEGPASGGEASGDLLLIGHLDTVFPAGTAAERPFRVENGRAYGPGVTDMKGGLLSGLHALAAIHEALPVWPFRRLVFVANPDEEIGSPVSTPVIAALAPAANACLVLECARANGDIVASRKGNLDVRLTIRGRAAHAGVEPEKGRSAVVEAAHQILALSALNGRWAGVTTNVGAVNGGTRPNVVAELAELQLDVRAVTREDLESVEAAIRDTAARPTVPDVVVDVQLVHRHWPMERLTASEPLIELATVLAAGLGFSIGAAATGGASDANTTAGLGVPTLDGLGPIGGLDHSPAEYLEVDSIVPRTTLLAGLIVGLGRQGRSRAVSSSTGGAAR